MFTHVPGTSFPMFREFIPPDVHTVLKFIPETADRYCDKIKIKHPGGQLKCLFTSTTMPSHAHHINHNRRQQGLTRQQWGHFILAICLMRERDEQLRVWTRPWLSRRRQESVYFRLVRELSLEDPGETQKSLAYQFRISRNLVCSIIPEVCQAIYQVLKTTYLCMPNTTEEWRQIASDSFSQWQFPMCIGALDGKRVLVQKPANSSSKFYDYKGHFSMILLAMVDADYKFIYVDVGACGRASDGGVWDRCSLKRALEGQNNVLHIPQCNTLPFSDKQCPFVLVGDDAFPLKSHLMKPYPGKQLSKEQIIFNYRLFRARKTSENAFGILGSRFQVCRTPIRSSPTTVKDIVLSAVTLHNYLRVCSKESYIPPDMLDREDIQNVELHRGQWH
ncbi:uncharacterized protein LOC123504521 [Portunus trituberculatus]|uniref:uncharacterized protein LOC123504521 n=1 Tax=Portunus trituberculatus TaxID=210409 RepID=UPI001E1CE6F7|nr:uncharacterized protein LOC123504521 [Portunus trituberculatus]